MGKSDGDGAVANLFNHGCAPSCQSCQYSLEPRADFKSMGSDFAHNANLWRWRHLVFKLRDNYEAAAARAPGVGVPSVDRCRTNDAA
jgi:hypothetical protein